MSDQVTFKRSEPRDDTLIEWRDLIIAALGSSSYKSIAEDVADEILCGMIRKAQRGVDITPCPSRLPRKFMQEALRKAQAMSHRLSERALEWEPAEDPTTFEADVPVTLNRIKVLEQVFSPLQVSGMVDVVRRGPFRWNDLAQATGISLRTFYSRLGEIRGAIPRSKPGFQSNKD